MVIFFGIILPYDYIVWIYEIILNNRKVSPNIKETTSENKRDDTDTKWYQIVSIEMILLKEITYKKFSEDFPHMQENFLLYYTIREDSKMSINIDLYKNISNYIV